MEPQQPSILLQEKEICAMAWCKVYSLLFRNLQRMLQKTLSNHMTTEHGNLRKKNSLTPGQKQQWHG